MTDNFHARTKNTYSDRVSKCKNPAAKKLLLLMDEKKSNLCIAADYTKSTDLLKIARQTGNEMAVLKTHIDAITDFSPSLIGELKDLANEHSFLLFEDRKFADIGNTVKLQYEGGVYKIVDWAHLVTAHSNPGDGVIQGLEAAVKEKKFKKPRGALLLAQMSSKENLLDEQYMKKTVQMGKNHASFTAGFIGNGSNPKELKKLSKNASANFPIITPGIKFSPKSDGLKQQYCTPNLAIKNGSDCIIVGRGITQAKNAGKTAEKYKKEAWSAYQKRTK
ncbi:MAG: orotidine-5'-phosphate decarboxylase [Candidatus Micrarchaeia archaeon]